MNTHLTDWIGSNNVKTGKATFPGTTGQTSQNKPEAEGASFIGIISAFLGTDEKVETSSEPLLEVDEKASKKQEDDTDTEKSKEEKKGESTVVSVVGANIKWEAEDEKVVEVTEKDAVEKPGNDTLPLLEVDEKASKKQEGDMDIEKSKKEKGRESTVDSVVGSNIKWESEDEKVAEVTEKEAVGKPENDMPEDDVKEKQKSPSQGELAKPIDEPSDTENSKTREKSIKFSDRKDVKEEVAIKDVKAVDGEQKEDTAFASGQNKSKKQLPANSLKAKVHRASSDQKNGPADNILLKNAAQESNRVKSNLMEANARANPKETPAKAVPLQGLKKEADPSTLKLLNIKSSTKDVPKNPSQQVKGQTNKSVKSEALKMSNAEGSHTALKGSAKGVTFSPLKASSPGKVLPGDLSFAKTSDSTDLKMDMDNSRQFSDQSAKSFKEVQMNSFSSSHITETGSRKAFTRQLARQINKQQFSQAKSASKQTSAWMHQRVVLKDGEAVHIAARSSDGALQLQLNAGSGKLGRLLHRHLQEIQQHVQQQLNVEINLQLKDYGGQQGTHSEAKTSRVNSPHDNAEGSKNEPILSTQTERRQIRYYGFNQNEWTA